MKHPSSVPEPFAGETTMILMWNVRYLDRATREFGRRSLYLDTATLDPVTRAAVELAAESPSPQSERDILKFRHLFAEGDRPSQRTTETVGWVIGVGPSVYFEDEAGGELAQHDIARVITGSPASIAIPPGAKQHDIDLMLAPQQPLPVATVTIGAGEIRALGYFTRDLRELRESAFMKDGPGSLKGPGGGGATPSSGPSVVTAVTDEEIRSFVMIFRRLYMAGNHDPGTLLKAAAIFSNSAGAHARGQWVSRSTDEYARHLGAPVDTWGVLPADTCTFTTKRLIDVFLYTQYAHQPSVERQRQFQQCLAEVRNDREILTWLFLTEMWKLSLHMVNVGKVIERWFAIYCETHKVVADVLQSLRDCHDGIGSAEKEQDRKARLFDEKVAEVATALWEQAGRPAGGPSDFSATACQKLSQMLNHR